MILTPTDISEAYLEFVKTNSKLPTTTDFIKLEISRDAIRHHYGNITNLHDEMRETHRDIIAEYVVTEHTVFSERRITELEEDLLNYKKFVVTTVVSGKAVNLDFYNSIKTYCQVNNAKLICIPCQDVVSRNRDMNEWTFPVALKDENFVHRDTSLNENLFISSIKMSAKHIRPITGIGRIGQRNGSYIFASPKQFLEYVGSSSDGDKMPNAVMTTGAITANDYSNDRYMSDRTSYIAENDHVFGAIVVDIESEKRFHFRQIQADSVDGSFYDLAVKYNADGTTEKVSPDLIMGDLHAGEHDPVIFSQTLDMIKELDINNVYVHDAFSGYSVTHYDENSPHKKAKKVMNNMNKFIDEVEIGAGLFSQILSMAKGKIFRVKGNHDEWFERYLERGAYVDDPVNHYEALDYAKLYLAGIEPLPFAYADFLSDDEIERIEFLTRDDDRKVGGVELAKHGDICQNGSKGSLIGAEKAFGDCVIGHSHTAAIHRSVYRVGTSTLMKLSYTSGPSTWTWTHCLVYPNGARQLITFVPGENITWKA